MRGGSDVSVPLFLRADSRKDIVMHYCLKLRERSQ